ncbi:hypothetical protein EYR40_010580 [Pleurotus pulmonarius]|nr:hypothetical protein EYR40_010580 [Pleurotus pulmonarius]
MQRRPTTNDQLQPHAAISPSLSNVTTPSVAKNLPCRRAQPPTTPQPFCDTHLLPPTPTAVQWRAESGTHRRRDKQLAREFQRAREKRHCSIPSGLVVRHATYIAPPLISRPSLNRPASEPANEWGDSGTVRVAAWNNPERKPPKEPTPAHR